LFENLRIKSTTSYIDVFFPVPRLYMLNPLFLELTIFNKPDIRSSMKIKSLLGVIFPNEI